eukprot:1621357-Rhodomonas_salina.1
MHNSSSQGEEAGERERGREREGERERRQRGRVIIEHDRLSTLKRLVGAPVSLVGAHVKRGGVTPGSQGPALEAGGVFAMSAAARRC